MFEKINKITFISSESCNLNCSYCELAKNAIKSSGIIINKKIKEDLLSGEYLKKY